MTVRRQKHIPIRSCVVCRQTSEKRKLLRVVRQPENTGGAVVVDESGKLSGRGAYVCANVQCIGLAQKQKRFERGLAVSAGVIQSDLFEKLLSLVAPDQAVIGDDASRVNPELDVLV